MLKAAVIGLGVGEQHISGYRSHAQCEVVKICDFNQEVLAAAKEKYPELEVCSNANEILEDDSIDIVSIASFDHLHYEQIVKGITNGKHLFVEKPLVLTEKHADHIWSLLSQNPDLIISSNLVMRKLERFSQLKSQISKGDFGELSYINAAYHYGRIKKLTEGWRGESKDYSIVLGGGIHIADLLLWLTGQKATQVYAVSNKFHTKGSRLKGADFVTSTIHFESGLTSTFTCNFGAVTPHFHQVEVYGTKLSFVSGAEGAWLYTKRDVKNGHFNYLTDTPSFPEYSGKKSLKTAYGVISKGTHIYEFVDAIVKKSQPKIDQQQIFNSMSLCFAIERSIGSGKVEQVKYY